MTRELLVSSASFAFFVVCPRMAGMMHVIHSHSEGVSMMATVMGGALLSIPMLMLMVYAFGHWGVVGALAFCVLTDFGAAVLMSGIGYSAAVETFIIALFVIGGVKAAPVLSKMILGIFGL